MALNRFCQTLLFVFTFVIHWSQGHQLTRAGSFPACTPDQRRSIMDSTLSCIPRDVIVRLEMPNNTYMHMAPDHVIVKRCGGSCQFNSIVSCIPTRYGRRNKTVPVWLYPVTSQPGAVSADCSVATLEEHTECECGCPRDSSSCSSLQRFSRAECSCKCLDISAKSACYNRPGWQWDERTCQCMCRPEPIQAMCATGSQFDPVNTCSCVVIVERAAPILEILGVIFIAASIMTIMGLAHCYRTGIGLFAHRRRDIVVSSRRNTNTAVINVLQPKPTFIDKVVQIFKLNKSNNTAGEVLPTIGTIVVDKQPNVEADCEKNDLLDKH